MPTSPWPSTSSTTLIQPGTPRSAHGVDCTGAAGTDRTDPRVGRICGHSGPLVFSFLELPVTSQAVRRANPEASGETRGSPLPAGSPQSAGRRSATRAAAIPMRSCFCQGSRPSRTSLYLRPTAQAVTTKPSASIYTDCRIAHARSSLAADGLIRVGRFRLPVRGLDQCRRPGAASACQPSC
jgi:hypothetical protein